MTRDEVRHWQKRARAELKTARIIYDRGDPEVLAEVFFHCHLAVELALKAQHLQEHAAPAPYTHNLRGLAQMIKGEWADAEQRDLDRLTDYAMLARYGDEEWHEEYATSENAMYWLETAEKFLSKIQS